MAAERKDDELDSWCYNFVPLHVQQQLSDSILSSLKFLQQLSHPNSTMDNDLAAEMSNAVAHLSLQKYQKQGILIVKHITDDFICVGKILLNKCEGRCLYPNEKHYDSNCIKHLLNKGNVRRAKELYLYAKFHDICNGGFNKQALRVWKQRIDSAENDKK